MAKPSPRSEPLANVPSTSGGASELLDEQQERFSQEIHDALLPLLFVARMEAERLRTRIDHGEDAASLDRLVDYLATASAEGRRLITEHHPPELVHSDWQVAIRHYLDAGLPPHHVEIRLELQPDTADVSAPVAAVVYRVVQEASRNAIRHASGEHLTIKASRIADQLQIEIRDDGIGFTATDVAESRFGLRSMRRRAESIGATLTVDSTPGVGTRILLAI